LADIIIPISLHSSLPEFFKIFVNHFGVKKYLGIFMRRNVSDDSSKNREGKIPFGRVNQCCLGCGRNIGCWGLNVIDRDEENKL